MKETNIRCGDCKYKETCHSMKNAYNCEDYEPMKENELREILQELYKQAFNGDFYHKHSSEHIDQSISQIIDLMIKKVESLERKEPHRDHFISDGWCYTCEVDAEDALCDRGHNSCLTQLKTVLNQMKET